MDVPLSPDHLRHCEWRVRQVYLALSDRGDLPEALRFFCRTMADYEQRDIVMLEQSARLPPLHAHPRVPDRTLLEVERSVATAEEVAAQAVLTTNDVLRLALQIEGSTLKRLDQVWIEGLGPRFRGVVQELAPDAEVRTRRLIEAIHTFGTDPSLRDEVSALWALH